MYTNESSPQICHLLTVDTLNRKHYKVTPFKVCVQIWWWSLEILPAQLCILMQDATLLCACNIINFGLLGCVVVAHLPAAVVAVLVCKIKAGQTRGGSALLSLCSQWLSYKTANVFCPPPIFLTSHKMFSRFWILLALMLVWSSPWVLFYLLTISVLFIPLPVPPILFLFSFPNPLKPFNP